MSRTLVIAEVWVNHDGSLDKALELVRVAADAGADVVKFQTFDPAQLVTDAAPPGGLPAGTRGCGIAAGDAREAVPGR